MKNPTKRFTTLDGLRGIAAVIVVVWHADNIGPWAPRFGYLAVDLFFLLSGFVVAHTYEPRFCLGMSKVNFIALRILRLYPLYLVGLLIGTVTAILLPSALAPADISSAFLLNLFILPSYAVPRDTFLFYLDGPLWSLFFEFWIANILFAQFRNMLDRRFLTLIIIVCAVGVMISERAYYKLIGGFSWDDFWPGFARVGFSFFLGVGIARFYATRPPQLALPSWLFLAGLPIVLSIPIEGRIAHLYELACVFFVFPAMVYWAADAIEAKSWINKALGDASYALYTIHVPLLTVVFWGMNSLSIQPNWEIQMLFVTLVIPLAWSLSIVDVRIRTAILKRARAES
jgi:peptidoglycan/LPS O-acetylase OafA/YrhL